MSTNTDRSRVDRIRATKREICNKLEGVPYASVPHLDLPSERTSEDPPFSHTGIDFARPLFVKEDGKSEKAYIFLFTCASIRAVHLELASGLSLICQSKRPTCNSNLRKCYCSSNLI